MFRYICEAFVLGTNGALVRRERGEGRLGIRFFVKSRVGNIHGQILASLYPPLELLKAGLRVCLDARSMLSKTSL